MKLVIVLATLSFTSYFPDALEINNLVFMDDSTLISSSKEGIEHMLMITEKFYHFNNTSANHNKYVLATNAVSTTQDLSPVDFNLPTLLLNNTSVITVTLFLCSRLSVSWMFAILHLAKLTVQQVVYLYNTVLIPKLEYRMQVIHLFEAECSTVTSSVRILIKYKAKLSHSISNAVLYLSQTLGLINLFSHQQQSHFTNLFLLANSSFFIKFLFIYRLQFIQLYCLIPISPLLVLDWTCWSSLIIFKQDYITSTIALLVSIPFCLLHAKLSSVPNLTYPCGHTLLYQCLSFNVFKSNLSVIYFNFIQKHGNARISKWYKNLFFNVTIPDDSGLLQDRFMSKQPANSVVKELVPYTPPSGHKKNWIVTLDNDGLPLFGKQIQLQSVRFTCTITYS
ncbi:hypothetical protein RhiirC2_797044 [Rhizophagus irregularis]|uniref:Reverse transcriptase domain-containing protein n=1 Tax=Rhizophagus irregularis TaxID=588596 RepID=A0A2N1M8M1_9GLOM|nr:hypothetical protein RhiirC2_797044 [Rhizophagus irregularis]